LQRPPRFLFIRLPSVFCFYLEPIGYFASASSEVFFLNSLSAPFAEPTGKQVVFSDSKMILHTSTLSWSDDLGSYVLLVALRRSELGSRIHKAEIRIYLVDPISATLVLVAAQLLDGRIFSVTFQKDLLCVACWRRLEPTPFRIHIRRLAFQGDPTTSLNTGTTVTVNKAVHLVEPIRFEEYELNMYEYALPAVSPVIPHPTRPGFSECTIVTANACWVVSLGSTPTSPHALEILRTDADVGTSTILGCTRGFSLAPGTGGASLVRAYSYPPSTGASTSGAITVATFIVPISYSSSSSSSSHTWLAFDDVRGRMGFLAAFPSMLPQFAFMEVL
ncbi:hypothetical protein C8R44DRAFT_819737, partial [Mycena epipterygia]